MKIGFIGLGNMAKAMIGGMLERGIASKEEIIGADKLPAAAEAAKEQFGISASSAEDANGEIAKNADVLILAVKPQFLAEAVAEFKDFVKEDTLVISIAAGQTIARIESLFGKKIKLVRVMPNTPALVLEGCSGVCRNSEISDEEMQLCMKLIGSFGKASEVPEKLMDAVTGLSGSGPAFVFMFIEAMADGAVAAGMPRTQAYTFAAQTVLGSAKLVLETGKHPGELKDMVCSPAGTTIEGVRILEQKGLRSSVMEAVLGAAEKSRNL